MKWLQYSIVRGCLKTNNTVHHIFPNISPLCHYCNNANERILHLMFDCEVVKKFWGDLQTFLLQRTIFISVTRNSVIFGMHDEEPNAIPNFIILAAKQYIWTNKFKTPRRNLSIAAFINILKHKIEDRIQIATLLNKLDDIDAWNDFYILL